MFCPGGRSSGGAISASRENDASLVSFSLAELDRERALLAERRSTAEAEVRADPNLNGSDLAGLAAFQRYVDARREQLAKGRAEQARKLAEF